MKPYELSPGDRFRVADACDKRELVSTYELVLLDVKRVKLSTHDVVISVTMTVKRDGSNEHTIIKIGPWVEVQKLD